MEKPDLSALFSPPNPGDIVNGRLIGKDKTSVFIDLSPLGTGIIFGRELSRSRQILKKKEVGDEVSAKMVSIDNKEGYIELSMAEAQQEMTWEELRKRKETNENFPVTINKANKGGLICQILGIDAFLPVSQLKPEHYPKVENGDQAKILQKLQQFIGKELKVTILSLNVKERSLILSEKSTEIKKIQENLKKYQVGDVVEGEVTGVVDFGAFMRFPTTAKEEDMIEGLIHISELDWQLIDNPNNVVEQGQKVKAEIIEIANNRVSLSLKALKKNPWEGIEKKYKKGDIVKGIVSKFNPFGVFIQVEPKIQGLVHISEFGNEVKMKNKLEENKKYDFQIYLINSKEHRMILKLNEKETKKQKNTGQKDKS